MHGNMKNSKMTKAKPFVKWVGGKGQLLSQLEALLPTDFGIKPDLVYIEPFVGGGAMLFHVMQKYPNIKKAIINDINEDLIICYKVVRDFPEALIDYLHNIQDYYYSFHDDSKRKEFFLECRDKFNAKSLGNIENASLFIFLNRTCFNGLYRVNKSGKFNVPFGRYSSPIICDADTIRSDSEILKRVEILNGDFESTYEKIGKETFFYFDPPYRPLNSTSCFNGYAKEGFNDEDQIRLKRFCDKLNREKIQFLLSNSDGFMNDENNKFFDDLFVEYNINRVWASRSINSVGSKRGKLTEIAVENYI